MGLLSKLRDKSFLKRNSNNAIIKNWKRSGRPLPPPHAYKQNVIKEIKTKYNINILVETGTYLGEMVEAQRTIFKKIYSIELADKLYESAVKKFEKYPYIHLLHGDSSTVLNNIMPQINEPAIFWLDGHFSAGITAKGPKECPIYEELTAILNSKNLHHVLLIDDARLFIGLNDYPTIHELQTFIVQHVQNPVITIEDDIIRVVL